MTTATTADLPPELYELWQERAAIMQFDGGLSVKEAEALALADVLGQAERPGASASTWPP